MAVCVLNVNFNDNYSGVSDIIRVQGKETFFRNITFDLTMKAHQMKMQNIYIYTFTKQCELASQLAEVL